MRDDHYQSCIRAKMVQANLTHDEQRDASGCEKGNGTAHDDQCVPAGVNHAVLPLSAEMRNKAPGLSSEV